MTGISQRKNMAVTDASDVQSRSAPLASLDDDIMSMESFLEKQDKEPKVRPPDGGYGWVIVFASIMVNVIGGTVDSYGVFYMHFLEYFGESNSATAWPGAICYAFILLAGPLASFVCHRWSHRTCCMLGSLIGAAGIFASAFVTNLYVMYFTFGIVAGVGFCFQFLSSTLISGFYFEKRRTLAMCIGITGVCVGDFILPPLAEIFCEHYAWQGALILMAAISLHSCVFGALMKPLPGLSDQEEKASFDMKVILDKRFVLFTVGESLWGMGCAAYFTIISEFATFTGYTRQEGAWLLSAMGVSSAISRLVVGFAANGSNCNRVLQYFLGIVISIIPLTALAFTKMYELYVFYSVLYGSTYGVIAGLSPVIVADIFGLERVTIVYGYVVLFDGIVSLVGPPIVGALFDLSGGYVLPWLFCASFTLIGALSSLCLLLLLRRHSAARGTTDILCQNNELQS